MVTPHTIRSSVQRDPITVVHCDRIQQHVDADRPEKKSLQLPSSGVRFRRDWRFAPLASLRAKPAGHPVVENPTFPAALGRQAYQADRRQEQAVRFFLSGGPGRFVGGNPSSYGWAPAPRLLGRRSLSRFPSWR